MLDGKPGVLEDLVLLVDPQGYNDAPAVRGQSHAGNAAHLNTGHKDLGAHLQSPYTLSPQQQVVARAKKSGPFAELKEQSGQQCQANEHKQANLPFVP